MMPTPHEISVAIVAACRETGEDPIKCASRERSNIRARHYAMHALKHIFYDLPPDVAARIVGCTGNPGSVYAVSRLRCFRRAGWWDEKAYCRIVFAIQECAESRQEKHPKAAPSATPENPVQSSPKPVQSPSYPVQKQVVPAPLKMGPLPPVRPPIRPTVPEKVKPPIGTLEPGGFRPAPGTYKKVLEDDAADKRFSEPYVPVGRPARKDDDFLRQAVLNTQKLTPPPED